MIINENDLDTSLLDYLFGDPRDPESKPAPVQTDEDLAQLGELFDEDE